MIHHTLIPRSFSKKTAVCYSPSLSSSAVHCNGQKR